jgi:hypothetical protein
MSHARKPRPPHKRREPGWLGDALRVATQLLAVSLTAAVLNGVGVAPVTGQCPGADGRPPVSAVLWSDASKMPQPGEASKRVVPASSSLARGDVVGRDGIEPPTLRFSAARSTD